MTNDKIWVALALSALMLGACGGEEETATETSSAGAPATEEAAGENAVVAAEGAPADGVVVRDEEGNVVRVGPNGETVEAEDSETGETATVTQADGTTAVEGGDGEQVVTNGEETTAREGGDTAAVRRDGVVATDGQGNQVVIRRDGRGVSVGGIRIGN